MGWGAGRCPEQQTGGGGEFVWRVVGSSGKVEPSELSVGGGGPALEARPAPTLGQPSSCCLPAVPGRGRAGEAAVHEGAAGVPAVRSLQDVHGEDPGKEDQERWEGPRPQAASACSWMGGSGQAIPHRGAHIVGVGRRLFQAGGTPHDHMQSRALSEEAWEADLALLAPSPEDSGSGLTNTLLNGHKVGAPPPRRASGGRQTLGEPGPVLMGGNKPPPPSWANRGRAATPWGCR